MIEIKLKKIKELENKTKKISMKDIKYFVVYFLFIAVVLSFIVKNIFLIPFTFITLATFSLIYYYFTQIQYLEDRKKLIEKIKEIENSEESLFKVLFNKEENFELMKELLASNKVDKDEIEDLYVNLSKKNYEELNIKNYIETYEYLLLLLKIKEKKNILNDIEEHIEEGVKKPFMKKLEKIKKLFEDKENKEENIKKDKKKKKVIIKEL